MLRHVKSYTLSMAVRDAQVQIHIGTLEMAGRNAYVCYHQGE